MTTQESITLETRDFKKSPFRFRKCFKTSPIVEAQVKDTKDHIQSNGSELGGRPLISDTDDTCTESQLNSISSNGHKDATKNSKSAQKKLRFDKVSESCNSNPLQEQNKSDELVNRTQSAQVQLTNKVGLLDCVCKDNFSEPCGHNLSKNEQIQGEQEICNGLDHNRNVQSDELNIFEKSDLSADLSNHHDQDTTGTSVSADTKVIPLCIDLVNLKKGKGGFRNADTTFLLP